jgi:hypothetical protein
MSAKRILLALVCALFLGIFTGVTNDWLIHSAGLLSSLASVVHDTLELFSMIVCVGILLVRRIA